MPVPVKATADNDRDVRAYPPENPLVAEICTDRAEYPAEHNVGHLYVAKPALAGFYQSLDPTNTFNPGIGHTPRGRDWQECNHASGGWPKGYSESA